MEQSPIPPGETDHGLVNGTVPVGVELHGGPHHVGRLGAAPGEQLHLVHGVQQLPVGGLKPVNLRNGPGDDDAHGVGHIVDFQGVGDGLLQHLGVQPHHVGVIRFFRPLRGGFLLCHFCPSLLYAPFQGIFLELFADHTAATAAPGLAARTLTYEISASSRYLYPLSAMWLLRPWRSSPRSRSKK